MGLGATYMTGRGRGFNLIITRCALANWVKKRLLPRKRNKAVFAVFISFFGLNVVYLVHYQPLLMPTMACFMTRYNQRSLTGIQS